VLARRSAHTGLALVLRFGTQACLPAEPSAQAGVPSGHEALWRILPIEPKIQAFFYLFYLFLSREALRNDETVTASLPSILFPLSPSPGTGGNYCRRARQNCRNVLLIDLPDYFLFLPGGPTMLSSLIPFFR